MKTLKPVLNEVTTKQKRKFGGTKKNTHKKTTSAFGCDGLSHSAEVVFHTVLEWKARARWRAWNVKEKAKVREKTEALCFNYQTASSPSFKGSFTPPALEHWQCFGAKRLWMLQLVFQPRREKTQLFSYHLKKKKIQISAQNIPPLIWLTQSSIASLLKKTWSKSTVRRDADSFVGPVSKWWC